MSKEKALIRTWENTIANLEYKPLVTQWLKTLDPFQLDTQIRTLGLNTQAFNKTDLSDLYQIEAQALERKKTKAIKKLMEIAMKADTAFVQAVIHLNKVADTQCRQSITADLSELPSEQEREIKIKQMQNKADIAKLSKKSSPMQRKVSQAESILAKKQYEPMIVGWINSLPEGTRAATILALGLNTKPLSKAEISAHMGWASPNTLVYCKTKALKSLEQNYQEAPELIESVKALLRARGTYVRHQINLNTDLNSLLNLYKPNKPQNSQNSLTDEQLKIQSLLSRPIIKPPSPKP